MAFVGNPSFPPFPNEHFKLEPAIPQTTGHFDSMLSQIEDDIEAVGEVEDTTESCFISDWMWGDTDPRFKVHGFELAADSDSLDQEQKMAFEIFKDMIRDQYRETPGNISKKTIKDISEIAKMAAAAFFEDTGQQP